MFFFLFIWLKSYIRLDIAPVSQWNQCLSDPQKVNQILAAYLNYFARDREFPAQCKVKVKDIKKNTQYTRRMLYFWFFLDYPQFHGHD